MSNYDSKWTGYGYVIKLKPSGNGKSYMVKVTNPLGAVENILFDDVNMAKAFFTGKISVVRDESVNSNTSTLH